MIDAAGSQVRQRPLWPSGAWPGSAGWDPSLGLAGAAPAGVASRESV